MTTPTPLTRTGYCVTAPSDAPDDADLIISSYTRDCARWTQADHDRWDRASTALLISVDTTATDHDVLLVTPWEYIAAVQWVVMRMRAGKPAGLMLRSHTEWRDMIRCIEHMGVSAGHAWWWVQDLAATPHDLTTRGYAAPYPDAPPALVVEHRQEVGFYGGLIGYLAVAPTLPTAGYPTVTGTLTPEGDTQ